jgi:hypothetical protein
VSTPLGTFASRQAAVVAGAAHCEAVLNYYTSSSAFFVQRLVDTLQRFDGTGPVVRIEPSGQQFALVALNNGEFISAQALHQAEQLALAQADLAAHDAERAEKAARVTALGGNPGQGQMAMSEAKTRARS